MQAVDLQTRECGDHLDVVASVKGKELAAARVVDVHCACGCREGLRLVRLVTRGRGGLVRHAVYTLLGELEDNAHGWPVEVSVKAGDATANTAVRRYGLRAVGVRRGRRGDWFEFARV
jgi:hypothetical protein